MEEWIHVVVRFRWLPILWSFLGYPIVKAVLLKDTFNNLSYSMSDSNKGIHILFLHSLLTARNLVPKACQLRYMDYSKYTQNHGSQGGDYKKLLNPESRHFLRPSRCGVCCVTRFVLEQWITKSRKQHSSLGTWHRTRATTANT